MYNIVICSFQQSLLRTIKHVYIYIYVCVCIYIDLCTFIFSISTLSFEFVFCMMMCLYRNNTRIALLSLFWNLRREKEREKMNEWIWKIGLRHLVRARTILSRQERHSNKQKRKQIFFFFFVFSYSLDSSLHWCWYFFRTDSAYLVSSWH